MNRTIDEQDLTVRGLRTPYELYLEQRVHDLEEELLQARDNPRSNYISKAYDIDNPLPVDTIIPTLRLDSHARCMRDELGGYSIIAKTPYKNGVFHFAKYISYQDINWNTRERAVNLLGVMLEIAMRELASLIKEEKI